MRKATIIVVAAMILLAGCGGGGGAASPTEESGTDTTASGTPMEETATSDSMEPAMDTQTPGTPTSESNDSGDDSSQSADGVLESTVSDTPFMGNAVVDGTTFNGSQQTSAVVRNDTANDRELIEFTDESGTTSEVYTTADYIAARNGTTGNVTYGGPNSFVGNGVRLEATFTAFGATFFIGLVEWEESGTTTVDGEEATVLESDTFNESAYEASGLNFNFNSSDVQSTDGRIVVTSDGLIESATVEIETADGTYGGEMTISYDDITLETPSWVDESEAPN